MKKLILLLVIIIKLKINAEELTYSINNRKSIQVVNDRFISFSVDPAVLLSVLNISDISYKLAKHLGPAYLRIAGPSTEYLEFTSDEKIPTNSSFAKAKILVTPKMWTELNKGLSRANFTPIFALNDKNRINGAWDPKSAFGILDLSDKLNMSCYWQLGYQCSNITEFQYKNDLMVLHHIMDAFPKSRGTWGIIGNDLNACSPLQNAESMRKQLNSMEKMVEAVALMPMGENFANIAFHTKPRTVPWAVAPSPDAHISFKSCILWAKQLGDAAVSGFEVIFRQPRLRELFYDTPSFWVSMLHKKFMGRNVLEVKAANPYKNTYVYSHCSKKQNSFTRRGAMTVYVVNDSPLEQTVALKIGINPQYQNLEVQSYILTSPFEGSKETYLNGEKLSIDMLNEEKISFVPKVRRARLNRNKHLTLSLPGKSIGFFVVPGARVPACIEREDEFDLLLEEIYQDQNNNFLFDDFISGEATEKPLVPKPLTSLNELYQMMQQELESDEKYYQKLTEKPSSKKKTETDWTQMLVERARAEKEQLLRTGGGSFFDPFHQPKQQQPLKTVKDAKQVIMNRAKEMKANDMGLAQDKHGLKKLLVDRANKNFMIDHAGTNKENPLEFELSSQEIRTILHDRAKAHVAEKDIKISSKEIDDITKQAAEKITQQHGKNRMRLAKPALRKKRAAQKSKVNFVNNEVKVATIYNPNEVAKREDEILKEYEEEDVKEMEAPVDIYAGFYQPPRTDEEIIQQQEDDDDDYDDVVKPIQDMFKPKPIFQNTLLSALPKISLPKTEFILPVPNALRLKRSHPPSNFVPHLLNRGNVRTSRKTEDQEQFVMEVPNEEQDSFDINADDDDLSNYHMFHENFGFSGRTDAQKFIEGDIWGIPSGAEFIAAAVNKQPENKAQAQKEQTKIQRTKEHLENYFNKEENFQGNERRKPIMNINDYYLSKTDKGHARNPRGANCQRRKRNVATSLKSETKLTSLNRDEKFPKESIHMQVGKLQDKKAAVPATGSRKTLAKYAKKFPENFARKNRTKFRRYAVEAESKIYMKSKSFSKKNRNENVLYDEKNRLQLDISNHLDEKRKRRNTDFLRNVDDSINEIRKEKGTNFELISLAKDVFDVDADEKNRERINFIKKNLNETNDIETDYIHFPNTTTNSDQDIMFPAINVSDIQVLFNDSDYEDDVLTSSVNGIEDSTTPSDIKIKRKYSNIQKIPLHPQPGIFTRIWDGFVTVLDKVESKISNYLNNWTS